MTAPKTKRNQPGFSQLGIWIRSGIMQKLQAAALADGRPQRDIVEDALAEYFRKPRDGSAKPAAT